MTRLLRAEWRKLTSTKLLWLLAGAAVLISVAAVAGATLSAEDAGAGLDTAAGIRRALHVTGTGAILVLVLGIIIAAGEYRTQTAVDTFLTTPRRHRVLAAKLVTGGVIGAAIGVLSAATALLVASWLFDREGASLPWDDAEVWTTLGGAVVYAGLFGVLGVSLGSLLRNQIAGIVGALAWLLVIEQIVINVFAEDVRWLPGAAGQAIVRTPSPGLLEPGAGVAVLTAYAALITVGGLLVARTRDA
jgi:ABC-type transport system involved in multi-copper enzyme maturation permease subunit